MEQLQTPKERIWEVDALRGALIIPMVLIHLIYDAVELYRFVPWQYPVWYDLFKNNYGALFILLSGLSATLGRRSLGRGLQVLAGGMICTLVTVGMYRLHLADRGIIIYFGVLHCLGVCMMLWPLFRRLNQTALTLLGTGLVLAGLALRRTVFSFPWLLVLGFRFPGFASSDYFPLMPNLGYFLLGAVLGRHFYSDRRSRFPGRARNTAPAKFLCSMGRHSLLIYLVHQPVLALLCELYLWMRG